MVLGRRRARSSPELRPRQTICVDVNRTVIEREVPVGEDLLSVLRASGLTGSKAACERGECGACTVLVDGQPTLSCVTVASQVSGPVVTVEGLGDEAADLRESFADCAAFQCGFCTPGHVVTATALLRRWDAPNRREIRDRIVGNLCRCTGYAQIVDAIEATARRRGLTLNESR